MKSHTRNNIYAHLQFRCDIKSGSNLSRLHVTNICTAVDTKSTYSCCILVCAFLFSNELSQCLYKIMSKLTISLKVYAHEHCRNIKLPVVSGSSWKDKNGLCHEKLYFLVHQSNISYFWTINCSRLEVMT